MKRNCNGCRASDIVNERYMCNLGYKVEQIKYHNVFYIGGKPLENCPKPKTYDDYLRQSKLHEKN